MGHIPVGNQKKEIKRTKLIRFEFKMSAGRFFQISEASFEESAMKQIQLFREGKKFSV